MDLEELKKFARDFFCVDIKTLVTAIKLSPNAQGYLSGAITELKLKQFLEDKGYEVLRIKEKWEGDKHPNHHGDFYIRKNGKDWFVLESKGVKSNSEKWHKLYNKENLVGFLSYHLSKTPFNSVEEIEEYIKKELPLFENEYSTKLYTINEINNYKFPKKETQKSKDIKLLRKLTPEQTEKKIIERLNYVMSKIKIIETHLVSGGSKKSKRTQATPRADEFHILSLDLVIRTGKHEFMFVNPKNLVASTSNRKHLQQNYIVGIIIKEFNDKIDIEEPWTLEFDDVFSKLEKPVNENDMQIDHRADAIEESTLESFK